ncbi:hypothetical protein MAX97_28685, partial [Escherichia coli]
MNETTIDRVIDVATMVVEGARFSWKDCWVPVPPDDDARAEFEGFNLAEFSRRVDQTRAALLSGLEVAQIVNPSARCAMVLSHPAADELADRLRNVGVVVPLPWDRPQ